MFVVMSARITTGNSSPFAAGGKVLNKGTEGNASRLLKTARQLDDSVHVCQHLMTTRPQREPHIGPRSFQEPRNSSSNGPTITIAVQICEDIQCSNDRLKCLGGNRLPYA